MPDHIYMLVRIPPKITVSNLMEYLKGKSSLMIFERHTNLKHKYGNRNFWAKGFFPEQYEAYYDELDPVMLGLVLEVIREYSGITKSDAADLIEDNRKTVHLIENGQRLPSLDYIYKFSKISSIS